MRIFQIAITGFTVISYGTYMYCEGRKNGFAEGHRVAWESITNTFVPTR